MAARHIVPVQPAGGHGQTVVVEVRQHGAQPLDVRLVGCEGESPYVTTVQQGNLGTLKQKFKGSDEEWIAVLSYFLLATRPAKAQAHTLEGVRMVYVLQNDKLELSIRQDIGDIKVTLGEIALPIDEEYEFNPFEWAQCSAAAHAETLKQLADLTARVDSEKSSLARLNAQLQDLIQSKNEGETAMLQQFMQLLNEKKRKIRDQSRILADAKVDVDTASTVRASRATSKSRKPVASRASKRKAPAHAAEPDPKPDSDSEAMEMGQAKEDEQEEEAEAAAPTTPDRSEDETQSEEEVSAPARGREKGGGTGAASWVAQAKKDGEDAAEGGGVPPRRALPFGGRLTRSRDVAKEDAVEADEDEDEDGTADEEEL